jgi:uncharacterized membrane protein YphA (DoxX/SURF4 family)
MSAITAMEDWADHHQTMWMDLLRIILGLVLIVRGVSFAEHQEVVAHLLENTNIEYLTFMAAQYLILVHIGGGLLIMLGLLTRPAAIINLPVLIGAVFFVNMPKGFTAFNAELWVSVAVLILLCVFLVYGDGDLSAEKYIEKHNDI